MVTHPLVCTMGRYSSGTVFSVTPYRLGSGDTIIPPRTKMKFSCCTYTRGGRIRILSLETSLHPRIRAHYADTYICLDVCSDVNNLSGPFLVNDLKLQFRWCLVNRDMDYLRGSWLVDGVTMYVHVGTFIYFLCQMISAYLFLPLILLPALIQFHSYPSVEK